MGELWFRVKDFFSYSRREQRDLFLAIIVTTFILAFNDKQETFSFAYWSFNFIKTMLFVAIAFLSHTAAQKVFALQQGFLAEFRSWPTGLGFGIIVALLTGGKLYVILPGGLALTHVTILRIGKWRYGENVAARSLIAASGSLANLIVATFALAMSRQLGVLPDSFEWLAFINFILIIYIMLPFPKLDGIHIFFHSRLTYVFIYSTLLAYILLTLVGILSWILAFIIGVVCWLLFYIAVESG